MREYESGAYIVSRRGGRRSGRNNKSPKRNRGAAGALVGALIFLTVAICLLVLFLPKLQGVGKTVSGKPSFGGKTYYALAMGKSTDYQTAAAFAQDTANRGGAGYLYNNGSYSAVAAVYERESDAKALSELNENSHYFSITIPKAECGAGDKKLLDYLCGDFFATVDRAATELDRGNADEASADYAAARAFAELMRYGQNAETSVLKAAIERTCDYDIASIGGRSVLSYIRFTTVRVIVAVSESLTLGV